MASIAKRPNGKWRARYRDASRKEHARHFDRKVDAQRWLTQVQASLDAGTYVDPRRADLTVAQWAEEWQAGYRPPAESTRTQAAVQLERITSRLGERRLRSLRPSDIRAFVADLQDSGYAPNTVKLTRDRLGSLMRAAVEDGLIPMNPVTRATAAPGGRQRLYVATTAQVWGLHAAMPAHLAPAVLLGAFAGLRVAEAAGLRVEDVDLEAGVIRPAVQYGNRPLKTAASRWPIPVPASLCELLTDAIAAGEGLFVVPGWIGRGCSANTITNAVAEVRGQVDGLPDGFRFHDLRHYYASALIAAGLDVKTVQTRLRHESARTTLDTYGHLMPDSHQASLDAVDALVRQRADHLRTAGGS